MLIETLTRGRSTRVRFYVVCILRITCIFLFVKNLKIPKILFSFLLVLLVEILFVGCLIVVDISTYLFLTLHPFCIHDNSQLAHFCTVFPPYFHTHTYSYTHTPTFHNILTCTHSSILHCIELVLFALLKSW